MPDETSDVRPDDENGTPKQPFRKLKFALVAALLLLMFFIVMKAATTGRGGVAVTISKETTYITKPLRPDGYVDYAAALNQRLGEGVTPENNAAVLFWQAIGPREIEADRRDEFFKLLGIPPLPEKGGYFNFLEVYAKGLKAADNTAAGVGKEDKNIWRDWLDQAMNRLWSKDELPEVAAWLEANEKPLALLVKAFKRPRWYNPLVTKEKELLMGDPIPTFNKSRNVARTLIARSMLRLSETKPEEAWEDVLACHRLARLLGQGPMMIDALVAMAIDGVACDQGQTLLRHSQLSATQIAKMQDDLAALPPLPKMVDILDVAERFYMLDAMLMMVRGETTVAQTFGMGSGKSKKIVKSLEKLVSGWAVNWDLILRMENSWCDQLVDALRKPDRADRIAAVERIVKEIETEAAVSMDWKRLPLSLLVGPRQALSKVIGSKLGVLFLSSSSVYINCEDRAAMRFELTKLAFALAAYKADHGSYPSNLSELLPKYVAEIPKDVFTAGELHYRQDSDGYLLYSVGVNSKDDGGGDDDLAARITPTVVFENSEADQAKEK